MKLTELIQGWSWWMLPDQLGSAQLEDLEAITRKQVSSSAFPPKPAPPHPTPPRPPKKDNLIINMLKRHRKRNASNSLQFKASLGS